MKGQAIISGATFSLLVPVIDWSLRDWEMEIKVIMTPSQRNTLFSNIRPGAVDMLYNVLGTPKFYDTTLEDLNTLVVIPYGCISFLGLRNKFVLYVMNVGEELQPHGVYFITLSGPAEERFCSLFPSSNLYPNTSLYPCYGLET